MTVSSLPEVVPAVIRFHPQRPPGRLARLLLGSLALSGTLAGVGCVPDQVDTVGRVEFRHRLAIPPLAPSSVDEGGRRVFDLRTQAGVRASGGAG